jgi:hypothetical protein
MYAIPASRGGEPSARSPADHAGPPQARVTEVHDVDGVLRVEYLVVEVIPAPPEEQTADITEELARRATPSLGYALD